jgi:2-desacetyl-2-hydroxyethyl bacteriochlorophyllide A dehydrogenase
MRALQAVIVEPLRVEVRSVELPEPAPNQILVRTEFSAVSAGTELAVYTGTHQWLRDPNLPDWKFPFRPGYSAAGEVVAVGSDVRGWAPGERISYPGNHASLELLTVGHERGRLWRLPAGMPTEAAAWGCIARYGLGAAIRVGITLGRSVAVLGLGVIGQFALRAFKAAGAHPIVGIDGIAMRREAAIAGGACSVIDPAAGDLCRLLAASLGRTGADIVADATGIPGTIPAAMSLACDGGQVVVVGSPRGLAQNVNFYDDLHRRYLEVTGAHGNMLFECERQRIPGGWDIDKAQNWLLAAIADKSLRLDGLVTQIITGGELGSAYDGLLNRKNEYLGVLTRWV